MQKNSNPFTPAINLYFALEASLKMMQKEGLNEIFKRHERHKRAAQAAMKAIGLKLFAVEGYGSPSITAVYPEGIDAEIIRKTVKQKFDFLGCVFDLFDLIFDIFQPPYICFVISIIF